MSYYVSIARDPCDGIESSVSIWIICVDDVHNTVPGYIVLTAQGVYIVIMKFTVHYHSSTPFGIPICMIENRGRQLSVLYGKKV